MKLCVPWLSSLCLSIFPCILKQPPISILPPHFLSCAFSICGLTQSFVSIFLLVLGCWGWPMVEHICPFCKDCPLEHRLHYLVRLLVGRYLGSFTFGLSLMMLLWILLCKVLCKHDILFLRVSGLNSNSACCLITVWCQTLTKKAVPLYNALAVFKSLSSQFVTWSSHKTPNWRCLSSHTIVLKGFSLPCNHEEISLYLQDSYWTFGKV